MAGQKQDSVFSHVEAAGGVGEVNLPVGESEKARCAQLVRRNASPNVFHAV